MPQTSPSTDPVAVVRSGVSRMFIWMGIALMVVGAVVGIGIGGVGALVTGDPSLLAMLLLTLIFGGAGILMHLAGKRSRVELFADRLTWTSVFTGPTTMPWSAVYRVEVPQHPTQGRKVRLILQDGRQVEVTAIGMSSGSEGTTSWADSGYLAAGDHIRSAHQAWLQQNSRP